MYYLNKETPLSEKLLRKILDDFTTNVMPKREKWKNYYDGAQAILNKKYQDSSKPCNKTVINYCKNITDSYNGYLATPSFISYSSEEDITEVMNVLRYNDYQTEDALFLKDALVHGAAAELMFIDNESHTRFKLIDPTKCFGIYDDSLAADLIYFVRLYIPNPWEDEELFNVEVINDKEITTYSMKGLSGSLTFVSQVPHYFGQCPANILLMPDEKSIFDCVMTQQDSINELLSAEIDDYQAFVDAYLTLEGLDADADDIANMKENRVLLLPLGAKADWLTKNTNDAQIENILKRLHDSIYRTAACPDFSSESFVGGVSSGIAIQYRLTGMETRAATIASLLEMALRRRIELICGIDSLKMGEEVFRDIKITFKRNVAVDNTTTINLINTLKGSVSDETLLGQLDFIDDVGKELERVEAQKQRNMAMYGFGLSETEEEAEE